jgi:hypothetical protein
MIDLKLCKLVGTTSNPCRGRSRLSKMRDSQRRLEHPIDLTALTAEYVDELLRASALKDPTGVRAQLDGAVEVVGIGRCVDDVLLPALRQIGLRWSRGVLDIETERMTTETVRGWLEGLTLSAPEPDEIAPLILACGPRDRHSIGLEALSVLLRHGRRSCRLLGSRASSRSLTTAVRANQPSGVVVVSHLRASRPGAAQSLRAVVATDPQVAIFYAGNAFTSIRLRRNLPGTYLGLHLQTARDFLLRTTGLNGAVIRPTERGVRFAK